MDTYLLPFTGGGSTPVQYDVDLAPWAYFVHYRYGILTIYGSERGEISFLEQEVLLESQLGDPYDGYWNARETNAYLHIISRSISSRKFDAADYPLKSDVRRHEDYRLGPLPKYPVGLSCGIHEQSSPPENHMNRHVRKKRRLSGIHDHDIHCLVAIPARDVVQWIADHPDEHDGFRRVYPHLWQETARDLELQP